MVKTNNHIFQVLKKPYLARMMVSCAVELYEYDIQYIPIGSIKSHIFADFLDELISLVANEAHST